ncbi:hypothetical protein Dimus_002601 [Dionaea muscipula]
MEEDPNEQSCSHGDALPQVTNGVPAQEEDDTNDEESNDQLLLSRTRVTESADRINAALDGGENLEGHPLSCPSAVAESPLMVVNPDGRYEYLGKENFGATVMMVENSFKRQANGGDMTIENNCMR